MPIARLPTTSPTRGGPPSRPSPARANGGGLISALTLVTAALLVYGFLSRRGWGPALALGGATPIGAALVLGGIAVPTFFAVAVGAAASIALYWLARVRQPELPWPAVPAGRCLMLFCLVAVLVTLGAPLVFDGLEVLTPGAATALSAGVVTKSNLAQMTYLVLSVCVVFSLARSRATTADLVALAAFTTTVLSFWAWLGSTGVPFPVGLFDNSPAFIFQNTLPGGAPRVRGILSEPAGLAVSSLVTLAYGASRFWTAPALGRLGILAVMAMAAHLGAVSTSATFFIAGGALLLVVGLVQTSALLTGSASLGPKAITGLCALAVAGTYLLPLAVAKVSTVVDSKLDTSSYADRSGSDDASYQLVVQTAGLGVGLGSNRASSFVATLLSTVGILGALLFIAIVWILLRDSWTDREVRPAAWALVALLVTKAVSSPDLADTSGILWISLGVLAHSALRRRAEIQSPHPPRPSPFPAHREPPLAHRPALAPAPSSAGAGRVLSRKDPYDPH